MKGLIKPSRVRFVNKKIEETFNKLKEGRSEEKEIYKWLVRAFEDIEENAFCGIQIPQRIIPKDYNVTTLFKYDLPKAWRLLYTIETNEILIISVILEWLDHKEYEQRFGY